jgi:hypothetical protein
MPGSRLTAPSLVLIKHSMSMALGLVNFFTFAGIRFPPSSNSRLYFVFNALYLVNPLIPALWGTLEMGDTPIPRQRGKAPLDSLLFEHAFFGQLLDLFF